MTLRGDPTNDDRLYTDDLANDLELEAFSKLITVIGDKNISDLQAEGSLELKNGSRLEVSFDLAKPLKIDVLVAKLSDKAEAMIGKVGCEVWSLYSQFDQLSARDIGNRIRKI